MQNSYKISNLATRAKILSNGSGLSMSEIKSSEDSLQVNLPEDFKKINTECSYEFIYFTSGLSFPDGVVETTKDWRANINLPHNYLVLSDDGTSAVLMKIDGAQSTVIWCSLEDVLRMCDGEEMIYDPLIFPTFTDFYSYLLDEEEKIRKENQQ